MQGWVTCIATIGLHLKTGCCRRMHPTGARSMMHAPLPSNMLRVENCWKGCIGTASDLRANHPSSSSLRERAGSGAPGPSSFSAVGKLT